MKKVQILVFCLCLFLTVPAILAAVIDVDTVLTKLNKPFVKSIQSADGDIIDCVDIYKQPAFDHPLLVNHTIQLKPTSYPEGVLRNISGETMTQLWRRNGSCPDGTIPIRRTTREEVLRWSSLDSFGKKRPFTVPLPNSIGLDAEGRSAHKHAIGYVKGGTYYGARGTFNVWKPKTQTMGEFSLAQMWVAGGDPSNPQTTETIEAGWQVSPSMYVSDDPRFFIFWTNDNYQTTGCYNLYCPGFVHVSKQISLGSAIAPVSQYSGNQFHIDILIWQERRTGNWWLQLSQEPIGYWPASLFKSMSGSGAYTVQWGGEIVDLRADGQHTTTEMGSGHWPGEGARKAAYINDLRIIDQWTSSSPATGIKVVADEWNCYSVSLVNGNNLFYGGPGRNPNCP